MAKPNSKFDGKLEGSPQVKLSEIRSVNLNVMRGRERGRFMMRPEESINNSHMRRSEISLVPNERKSEGLQWLGMREREREIIAYLVRKKKLTMNKIKLEVDF